MLVGPRIVFMRFQSSASPKLVPWLSHTSRVIGVPLAVSQEVVENLVVWQLVSANNRELARGIGAHESFDEALANASIVADSGDERVVELVSNSARGDYGWFVTIGGVPVMTCARWYFTDRDRRHSIELALKSISIAQLHTGARLSDPALMAGDREYR
jgi:hypothetical protein